MPAEKFSISLPDDLAVDIEALARLDGVSRSTVIQEASARYVAARKMSVDAERRTLSLDAALRGFDEIAAQWGQDDRSGVDYLDELRGEIGAADRREVPPYE